MIIEGMHRKVFALALMATVALALPSAVSAGAELAAVDVQGADDGVRVELLAQGDFTFRTFRMNNPPRLVIDLVGATKVASSNRVAGDGEWIKSVRMSQFATDPSPVTRVVMDLATERSLQIRQTDRGIEIIGGEAPSPVEQVQRAKQDLASDPATLSLIGVSDEPQLSDLMAPGDELITPDNWQDPSGLDQVAETDRREDDASYARTMTINLQNADIKTILRSVADFSGRNIVSSPAVEGQVTVSLRDVPWREALSVILAAYGFGFVEENGIIRVDTAESLREAELLEKSADRRSDELEALVTRIVPIDFANAEEVKSAVENMLTARGSIDVDDRTNSLIVNDIPASVDAVAELTRELDTRTPQVHIDALLVDLDTRRGAELGVNWGAFNIDTGTNLVGDAAVSAPITEAVGAVRIGTVQDFAEIRATVQAMARDNVADIISNPRITTTDNREANILVGQKIPLITQDMAGNAVTRLETIGIRLIVTPHINSDEQITLDVHPEVSDLSSQATVQGGVIINTSEADTRVLVGNKETAVIGGLIRSLKTTFTSGVPVLKDIPLLGALFRSKSTNDERRELIVFLTPTIVDEEGVDIDREMHIRDNLQDRIYIDERGLTEGGDE